MISWFRSRLAAQHGFTLIELLVALSLTSIVLGAVTSAFTAGFAHQARSYSRLTNEENARQALARLRLDVHCASGAVGPSQNSLHGWEISFLEAVPDNTTEAACRSIHLGTYPTTGIVSHSVSWCTVRQTAVRWRLYRENLGQCDGDNSTFMVDYIVEPDVWRYVDVCNSRDVATPSGGWQNAIGIVLRLNTLPATTNAQGAQTSGDTTNEYRLTDVVGLRNTQRRLETVCTAS
jgi:prepilin-type N-terminal cleavage/methylation domain-containing protein